MAPILIVMGVWVWIAACVVAGRLLPRWSAALPPLVTIALAAWYMGWDLGGEFGWARLLVQLIVLAGVAAFASVLWLLGSLSWKPSRESPQARSL